MSDLDLALAGFDDFDTDPEIDDAENSTENDILTPTTYWVTIKGPLLEQAEVLDRIKKILDDLPGAEIEGGFL